MSGSPAARWSSTIVVAPNPIGPTALDAANIRGCEPVAVSGTATLIAIPMISVESSRVLLMLPPPVLRPPDELANDAHEVMTRYNEKKRDASPATVTDDSVNVPATA